MAYKFVNFDGYCLKCKNLELEGYETPCNECLATPVNDDSMQPVFFKEKEEEENGI